jgi:hypothetical protein
MGIVRWGPPEDLVLRLRDRFGLDTFVETGTFQGATAAWAARHFHRVLSVELSPTMFARASATLGGLNNVEMAQDHSVTFLEKIVRKLEGPALFWLDAHWCGGAPTGGSPNGLCPLLDEIAEVNRSTSDHFILIDDARYFLTPPEPPYNPAFWPSLWEVMTALHGRSKERYSIVLDDVIVAVPVVARDLLVDYSRAQPR